MSETEQTEDTPAKDVETLFHETSERFSGLVALGPSLVSAVLIGFHSRLDGKRVKKMLSTERAQQLRTDLEDLSASDIRRFLRIAVANKEQADAAFRYTAIVNFTLPITLVVGISQIFPNSIPELLSILTSDGPHLLILVSALFVTFVLVPIVLAYANVQAARDIYHLALIETDQD